MLYHSLKEGCIFRSFDSGRWSWGVNPTNLMPLQPSLWSFLNRFKYVASRAPLVLKTGWWKTQQEEEAAEAETGLAATGNNLSSIQGMLQIVYPFCCLENILRQFNMDSDHFPKLRWRWPGSCHERVKQRAVCGIERLDGSAGAHSFVYLSSASKRTSKRPAKATRAFHMLEGRSVLLPVCSDLAVAIHPGDLQKRSFEGWLMLFVSFSLHHSLICWLQRWVCSMTLDWSALSSSLMFEAQGKGWYNVVQRFHQTTMCATMLCLLLVSGSMYEMSSFESDANVWTSFMFLSLFKEPTPAPDQFLPRILFWIEGHHSESMAIQHIGGGNVCRCICGDFPQEQWQVTDCFSKIGALQQQHLISDRWWIAYRETFSSISSSADATCYEWKQSQH